MSGEIIPSTSVVPLNTGEESTTNRVDQNRLTDDELSLPRTRTSFLLEVPVLLLFFAWNLSGIVFQNEILFQSCITSLGHNVSECDSPVTALEAEVEKYASKIFMCRAVLESIIPAFISFLIGPWSDKYGRKPILLSTFLGYFLVYVMLTIISVISTQFEVSPWYYLFAFIPISLLGGTCALITGIFCYISDVSNENNRAFRMVRMEAAVFVGLLLGSLGSPYLYEYTNGSSTVVFLCAAIVTLIALVCVYKLLKESIKQVADDISYWGKFKALFERKHVIEMFQTCFKRRENNNRIMIWLIMFSLAASIFVLEGSITLSYMFMREKFQWTITDYNLYSATNVICQVFGNIFGTYVLNKMFGIQEIVIAAVGYCSAMTEYIVTGLASYSWELYVTSIVVMLKGVATPMCRSFLANLVPSNEIGKIYSLTTSMESLSPIGAAPIYTFIYNFTLDIYPGAFNFVSAFIYLCCALIIMLVYILHRRQRLPDYRQIFS